MVVYHCSAGRIKGAKKMGNTWLVPADTKKTADERYRNSKVRMVKINETDIFGWGR